MKKMSLIIYIVILVAAFFGGRWWQQFIYTDLCLDMGGGTNPNNYPICVLEVHAPDRNPTRSDGIYFCDEKGNKFISKEEARKHGLQDSEFGATFCAS